MTLRLMKGNRKKFDVEGVFNQAEVTRRCEVMMQQVGSTAESIIQQAKVEADDIHATTEKQAWERGLNQGLKESRDRVEQLADDRANRLAEEKVRTALPSIQEAVLQLHQQHLDRQHETLQVSVDLSLALVERLFHRLVDVRPEILRELLAEPIQLATGCTQVEIKMHPADFDIITGNPTEFVSRLSGCDDVRFVKDSTITRGGCLVVTEHGEIDATVETRLNRIASELIPD